MSPLSIAAYAGISVRMRIAVNNPNGTPYDLTGCTYLGFVRASVIDQSVLQTWAVTLDGAPTSGAFFIFLSEAQTATLSGDSYVFDIRITPPSGEAFIILGGSHITMQQSVTR